MHKYANPARFQSLANTLLPWTFWLAIMAFGLGLFYALIISPPDYQQGESVRIMYVHVPAALMAEGAYVFMALASAVFIIWKHPLAAESRREPPGSLAPPWPRVAILCGMKSITTSCAKQVITWISTCPTGCSIPSSNYSGGKV